ncbi:hypothetical protein [Streptomyces sp. CT34]|uniref:hypothetical protein n=1 Tax=Streptomyces sp. CT34 TaxID=1553907 RepID=UPI0005BDCBD5|nr:hypothetical protein [Streptomyces sp. CT34]
MLKLYYRLVYWKRRLGRALGVPRTGAARTVPGPRTAYGTASRRTGRVRQLARRARPLLVFAVMVLIVVVASALLGWRDDTFGAGPREGGTTVVQPSGELGRGGPSSGCDRPDTACAVAVRE